MTLAYDKSITYLANFNKNETPSISRSGKYRPKYFHEYGYESSQPGTFHIPGHVLKYCVL